MKSSCVARLLSRQLSWIHPLQDVGSHVEIQSNIKSFRYQAINQKLLQNDKQTSDNIEDFPENNAVGDLLFERSQRRFLRRASCLPWMGPRTRECWFLFVVCK